jgi:hypothetical protein
VPALKSVTIALAVEVPARKCTKPLVVALGIVTGLATGAGVGEGATLGLAVGIAVGLDLTVDSRVVTSSVIKPRWPMAKAASVRPAANNAKTDTPDSTRSVRLTESY